MHLVGLVQSAGKYPNASEVSEDTLHARNSSASEIIASEGQSSQHPVGPTP